MVSKEQDEVIIGFFTVVSGQFVSRRLIIRIQSTYIFIFLVTVVLLMLSYTLFYLSSPDRWLYNPPNRYTIFLLFCFSYETRILLAA